MKSLLKVLVEFLLTLFSTIFISEIVCFVFGYRLFDINSFGFQLLIYSLLTTFLSCAINHLKLLEIIFLAFFWGFVFAYFLGKTSMMNAFNSFPLILFYSELLMVSFSLLFFIFWNSEKIKLRGLTFNIVTAAIYAVIHYLFHLILTITIDASQFLQYFSNGLAITLTISLALNFAATIIRQFQQSFFQEN